MNEKNEEELKSIRISLDEAKQTVFQLERRVSILEEQQRCDKEQAKGKSAQLQMEETEIAVSETTVAITAEAQTEETSSQQPKKELETQAAPRRQAPQLLQSMPRKGSMASQSSGGPVRLLQEERKKAQKQPPEQAATSKNKGKTFQWTQKMILPSIFAGMMLLGVVWLLSVLNSYGLITPLLKISFFYLVSVGLFFIARKKMPQRLFRQLLYGLAFAVAILTTGAGVLLYHLLPLFLGFVLTVAILLVGFWISREEKSEILTIGMLVTSLLLPHLMIVENLSILVVIFYLMVTVGFVSWFDKENQFQVSEVVKNVFTLLIILHIGRVSVLLGLLTLLLGLLLLASNVFVALRKNVRGRWFFAVNSGIAGLVLVVTLCQIYVESQQWLWPALVVWGVCLGLSYALRTDAVFQDLYFGGSSLFILMAAFTVPTSFWSTWHVVFAVVIAVSYFSVASRYHLKRTTAAMTGFFVFIALLSLFGEWQDQAVIGIGLASVFAWIYHYREKGMFLSWIVPTFVISAHLWFSLTLYSHYPNNLWMIAILLLSAAGLQQWWRPMTKVYANYLLGYQAVIMYGALPIYLMGLFVPVYLLWVIGLLICAYLLFALYKQLRFSAYATLGAYVWIFVSQFPKMTLIGGLGYLLIGLLTWVGIGYQKKWFALPSKLYVRGWIVWDILLLIWLGLASQNSICALVIGLSLSGLAILTYQDWQQKEDWLLQNYLMVITIFDLFLFVLFPSVHANGGMRFIAMLLSVLFFADFTYLGRAYYSVRKPVGIQQIRLANVSVLIAWLFILWRTVATVNQMLGSSDFVRDISISIVLFLYGLLLLWYGNKNKQNHFERYSLMIILFSIAKIILYDFHGIAAMVRGMLFLVLGTVGFFTMWRVERK